MSVRMRAVRDWAMVAGFAGAFFGLAWAARSCSYLGNYKESLRAAQKSAVKEINPAWLGKSMEDTIRDRGDSVNQSIEVEGE